MSVRESLRKLSREDIEQHAARVIAALEAEPEYIEACERAHEMGVEVRVSVGDTYTPEKKSVYVLPADEEEIPLGYRADLRVDLVRDGRILFIRNEDGTADQLTASCMIIDTPETFFVPKLTFYEYDETDGPELPAYLQEYLDRLEETEGGCTSVLSAGDEISVDAAAQPAMLSLPDLPEDGEVVEWIAGPFAGVYMGKDSAFFETNTFRPLAILLEARRFGSYVPHGVTQLDAEGWAQFCEDMDHLVRAVRREPDFFSALLSLELYSLEPSENEKRLLNRITTQSPDAFEEMCRRLAEWGEEQMMAQGEDACLSVVWP